MDDEGRYKPRWAKRSGLVDYQLVARAKAERNKLLETLGVEVDGVSDEQKANALEVLLTSHAAITRLLTVGGAILGTGEIVADTPADLRLPDAFFSRLTDQVIVFGTQKQIEEDLDLVKGTLNFRQAAQTKICLVSEAAAQRLVREQGTWQSSTFSFLNRGNREELIPLATTLWRPLENLVAEEYGKRATPYVVGLGTVVGTALYPLCHFEMQHDFRGNHLSPLS